MEHLITCADGVAFQPTIFVLNADAVEHARIGIEMDQSLARELWDDVQYHLEEICGRQDQCCFGMCMLSPSDIKEYGQRLFDITVDKQCADLNTVNQKQ